MWKVQDLWFASKPLIHPLSTMWTQELLTLALMVVVMSPQLGWAQVAKPGWQPRFLGQVSLKHAAFMEMYFSEDTTLAYQDRWTLFISTFDSLALGQNDPVFRMNSPGRYLDNIGAWNIALMDESALWPNNPDYLPSSVCGKEGVIWTSGFLVPTKTNGQLQLYDTTVNPALGPFNIASLDTRDWSYHRVVWKDMDADGDLDALTARFDLPTIGATKHELVYYENQGTGFSEGWNEHIIGADGADVHFATVKLSAGGRIYDCVILGEFFNQRIAMYWTESLTDDWSDASLVKYRVITTASGQTFDVLIDDLNRDGEPELVVTQYHTDVGVGDVTVYFFPADFRIDEFTSVVIADGFVPNQIIGGQSMSPGTPKTYYPTTAYAQDLAADGKPHKPWLLVSGDDDGRMYIVLPTTDVRTDWTYEKHILTDTTRTTVGKMAHGDVDGDGYEEIIVAGYTIGQVYVYTYAP